MIAGFVDVTEGELLIDGRPVADLPPYRRNIGMVFQHYALFPHATVIDNVEYPLRQRKMAKALRREKVAAALRTVGLDGYGKRMPRNCPVVSSSVSPSRGPWSTNRARAAHGRTARRAGQETARFAATRDQAHSRRTRHHVRLRHARPGRSAGPVGPHRGVQQSAHRADRLCRPSFEHPQSIFVARFLGESSLFYGKLEDECIVNAYGRRIVAAQGESTRGDSVAVVVRPERIRIAHG